MAGGEIAKRQPRAEGDAGARIGAGHQRIHVVSHRVQPRDGVSLGIDDRASAVVTVPREVPRSPV